MTELLATPEAFAAARDTTYDPTDLTAVMALEAASEIVRRYCRRRFTYVADDTVILDGTGRYSLLLPQYPVVEVTSITEDDVELVDNDDWIVDTEAGILYRRSLGYLYGALWNRGRHNVTVTYSHGYTLPGEPPVDGVDPLPSDLQLIVAQIASRALVTVGGGSSGDVESETIGSYSVTYATPGTAGGGSALKDVEAAVLDLHRDVRFH